MSNDAAKIDLAARQQCLEAERLYWEMADRISNSVEALATFLSVPSWGHCYCGTWDMYGLSHSKCCKCGDVRMPVPS